MAPKGTSGRSPRRSAKPGDLGAMTVSELVERFVAIAHEQERAHLEDDYRKLNLLYWRMDAVREELKGRDGDQRRALLPLLRNPSLQVVLKAAKSVLALEPERARETLQAIRELGWQRQAMEAGMTIPFLDDGVFKPK